MTILWFLLTGFNLVSLLSYRSPSTPLLLGYSAKYLALVAAYLAAVAAVSPSLLERLRVNAVVRFLRLSGIAVLFFLQLLCLFEFNGLIFATVRFPWAFPMQSAFSLFFAVYCENALLSLKLGMLTGASLAAVKILDVMLRFNSLMLPGLGLTDTRTSIRTLDLFPYEGWHIQADFAHKGDMPWEDQPYKDYEVNSGTMGFFVDFDLRHPPKKAANEFRIILVGGSGAQGWGGQRNDLMFYRLLEKDLNARLAKRGRRVRVINLAMSGAGAYQNFIALNRWGHALEPDMILSYSGANDVINTALQLNDAHFMFPELDAYVLASRASEFPPPLNPLRAAFPNLMTRTNFGIALKLCFSYAYYVDRARRSYRANRGIECSTPRDCMAELTIPLYVGAMQSVKRDFQGIPILIAWQAADMRKFEPQLGAGFYDALFEEIRGRLARFMNDDWSFINVHALFEKDPPPYIGVHLGNQGHAIVAKLLADRSMDFVGRRPRLAGRSP